MLLYQMANSRVQMSRTSVRPRPYVHTFHAIACHGLDTYPRYSYFSFSVYTYVCKCIQLFESIMLYIVLTILNLWNLWSLNRYIQDICSAYKVYTVNGPRANWKGWTVPVGGRGPVIRLMETWGTPPECLKDSGPNSWQNLDDRLRDILKWWRLARLWL